MSWKTFVRAAGAGAASIRPTAGAAVGACVGTRVSLRDGSWLASASAASAAYMSTKVATTRGSSALALSWRSRPIAASRLIAL